MNRDDLLDFLLGEADPVRAAAVEAGLAADPAAEAERARFERTLSLIREACRTGWEAEKPRLFRLSPLRAFAAAAALLLVVLGLWYLHRPPAAAIYEPGTAFGYLRASETGPSGEVPEPATGDGFTLRTGAVSIAAAGGQNAFPLKQGEPIPADSEVSCTRAVRIDGPRGAILFLGPRSSAILRRQPSGGAAVRLRSGTVALVAAESPARVAVESSDLLVSVRNGACLVNRSPGEAVALRGTVELDAGPGRAFVVPEGHRLPAACAKDPVSVPVEEGELELEWYDELLYGDCRDAPVEWARSARGERTSVPIRASKGDLLFVELLPDADGRLALRFGGGERTFEVARGRPFRLRVALEELGPGPALELAFPGRDAGLRAARICRFYR